MRGKKNLRKQASRGIISGKRDEIKILIRICQPETSMTARPHKVPVQNSVITGHKNKEVEITIHVNTILK